MAGSSVGRQDSRRGIPRVLGTPRGGPCGRPAARRAQRLAAVGAPRAFASILRTVPGGRRAEGRAVEGRAVEGRRGLQSAWGRTSGSRAAVRASTLVAGNRRVTAARGPAAAASLARRMHPRRKAKRLTFYLQDLPLSSSPVSQSQQPGGTCPKLSNFIIAVFYSVRCLLFKKKK